ncbi:hypothetical protein M427DRAFT_36399 [Gonapodya prolifera JEL478]|uniref:Uncharacterized protein n=1 Tax=Gonapodya prolifera (strain JEL478) TaxID=1344416 RepID=A0A139A323_GONPJ|nr:hypothetical protein M427DRAFT_36399 [Gonapodya prolifera JEL478]|eukprot:KXS10925.1 hypothetical protein M427DRAFT_36399 [Gonapodya prolifera JEL478]
MRFVFFTAVTSLVLSLTLGVTCSPLASRNNGGWNDAAVPKYIRECVKRKAVLKAIYDQVLAVSNPVGVLTGQIDISNLFHPEVRARVTPLGEFEGRDGVEEYFYGLGAGIVQNVFKKFLCDPTTGIISAHVVLVSDFPPLNLNYTHVGYWSFNDTTGTVNSIDLNIINFGITANPSSLSESPRSFHTTYVLYCNVGVGEQFLRSVGTCLKYQNETNFVGSTPEQMYADCSSFLHSIDFGTWDAVNQNTTICRYLHSTLTQYRPAVHCAHMGKTGGEKCVPHTWQDYYKNDY